MNPDFATLAELRKALDTKEISSKELTERSLHNLSTLGKEYRAVAELTTDLAMSQAQAADKRIAEGKTKGVLDGIPYGAKDLLATKGIPTRWGSPGHHDQVFDYDATAISKLSDAGAVLVAKLAMIELAGGGNYNVAGASATGACLSAYDKTRWAGGSSSGSGAATGLGCVPFALGSETAGSIVCPSAFNGLTGFRPTYGRISKYGAMTLSWTLDRVGPLARNAEDAATVFAALAGYDEKDATTAKKRLNLHRSDDAKGLRIGLLKEDFKTNKAGDCEKAYQEAVEIFKRRGYEIVDVAYPDLPYNDALTIIINAEQASAHEAFIRGPRFNMLADVNQIAGFAASLLTPATDYLWAMRIRAEMVKANEVWKKCDVIFTPTFYHQAPPVDVTFDKSFELLGGDSGPSNLLGWPAMAFPIGFEGKAPLSATVLAPCWREDLCYKVARDYQMDTSWHHATTFEKTRQ